jgi:hypothetical protein
MIHPTLAAMKAYRAPMTREEFLNWEYLGSVPGEISAEEEETFPPEFRLDAKEPERAA